MQRSTFPAPRRCSHEIPHGGFLLKRWTEKEVRAYLEVGGWFQKGRHDFASVAAAKAAGVKND